MITKQDFGSTPDGRTFLYTLKNEQGVEVAITNFGGIIQSLKVPDKNGQLVDVVLGFDNIEGYLTEHPFFGAIIGRYGNRIAKGIFKIGDQTYNLATNNEPNHLHGGVKGFDKVIWSVEELKSSSEEPGLILSYLSKDGDQGYPGNLNVQVTYRLTKDNSIEISYHATTDQATYVNLTNHSYFNLNGAGVGDILDHELMLHASKFTPVDPTLIPTGVLADVTGTPFDFSNYKKIGQEIDAEDEQIGFGGGYDHNFVLDAPSLSKSFASVRSINTGIVMSVFTEEPGVQLYSGNFLDGTNVGKGGAVYHKRYGFCLETQHYPDSPNQSSFPTTLLEPGHEYKTKTIYQFEVAAK